MTQASPARLEKRLNKKKPNQTRSFDQLVGDTTIARLKPYIQQQIGMLGQQIVQSIYQTMMQERSMMQTRQLAFENLLRRNTTWFNDEVLAMEVASVEDQAEGATEVEAAEEGDKVRVEFQSRYLDQGEWSTLQKLAVHSLLRKGPQGNVQTGSEAFEKALLGMKAGETREFLLPEVPEEGKEPENTRIKVTVKRVSRRPGAPTPAAAPTEEAAAPAGEVPANAEG